MTAAAATEPDAAADTDSTVTTESASQPTEPTESTDDADTSTAAATAEEHRKLAGDAPGTFLLESAEHGGVWSRYSFIGAASRATPPPPWAWCRKRSSPTCSSPRARRWMRFMP